MKRTLLTSAAMVSMAATIGLAHAAPRPPDAGAMQLPERGQTGKGGDGAMQLPEKGQDTKRPGAIKKRMGDARNKKVGNEEEAGPGAKPISGMAKKGFNPQPEPPGKMKNEEEAGPGAKPISGMAKKGFNPQPEPPGKMREGMGTPPDDNKSLQGQNSDLAKKGFNPQPEPPGKDMMDAKGTGQAQ